MSHDYCHLKPCSVCRDEGTINDQRDTIKKLRAENRDLKARLKAARERIDDLYDPEIGEGTRGEVRDPLLDVLDILNTSKKGGKR